VLYAVLRRFRDNGSKETLCALYFIRLDIFFNTTPVEV